MLSNLTIGRYLCFHKRSVEILVDISISVSAKVSSFWKGIQQSGLIIEMMIQKKLKGLKKMKVLIISNVKVFLGNKYNSYIYTAPNAKVVSTRNVYEKTVKKRNKKGFQRRI